MSLRRVVLFQHEITACPFEKDFYQVGAVAVVINNQDAVLFFDRRVRAWAWPGEIDIGFPRKEICFNYLVHIVFDDVVLVADFSSSSAKRRTTRPEILLLNRLTG